MSRAGINIADCGGNLMLMVIEMYHLIFNLSFHLYTDASSTVGFGDVLNTAWFYGRWQSVALGQSITILELHPIVVAVSIWAVHFHTTNQWCQY